MTQALEQITHEPPQTATRSIIWMHGLGAGADDFLPILPYLHLSPATRVIFPQAPIRTITVNNGMKMPGWYDIRDFSLRDADREGIRHSAELLYDIYRREIDSGIDAQQIYFAGFSQGGVMALHLGLHHLCGGIIALSCYLADAANVPSAEDQRPILQMHGRHDPIVDYRLGEAAHAVLTKKGYAVQWHSYDMGHEVIPAQINDLARWLQAQGL